MLGLTEYMDKPIFAPSLFVTIRKRITTEDINALTLALAKKSGAKKEKKDGADEPDKTRHTDIKVDATCADAEVKYPTDCGLLDDSARFIERMLKKACKLLHIAVPRDSRSLIHAKYIRLTKLRHKGKKTKDETLRYMLSHVRKDIMKLSELLPSVWNSLNITEKRTMAAVIKVYRQQEYMFKDGIHTCKDRIVSIFQPHVRPIVRGKAGAR